MNLNYYYPNKSALNSAGGYNCYANISSPNFSTMAKETVKMDEFVRKISALWVEQKKREILYLEALKKDGMGSLRRMLSQGHFSAVLFQKEIRWIYDYFKCFLTDKELGEITSQSSANQVFMQEIKESDQVFGLLKKNEGTIILSYKSLFKYIDRESEARRILDDHLERISEFHDILSKLELSTVKTSNFKLAI